MSQRPEALGLLEAGITSSYEPLIIGSELGASAKTVCALNRLGQLFSLEIYALRK